MVSGWTSYSFATLTVSMQPLLTAHPEARTEVEDYVFGLVLQFHWNSCLVTGDGQFKMANMYSLLLGVLAGFMLVHSWECPLPQVDIWLWKPAPQVRSFLSLLPTSIHLLTWSHMFPYPLTPIPPTRLLFFPLPGEIHVFPLPFLHTVFLLSFYTQCLLLLGI